MSAPRHVDLGDFVREAAGELVVQPRMGMADPAVMSDGLRAVARAGPRTVCTITLDSYTRVGDHDGARLALAGDGALNGFPLVVHGSELTARVAASAGIRPVQVRHGSAQPEAIFHTLVRAGLSASEGGPVSYCLPYGRTPLVESVARWRDASRQLAEECDARGRRAHLETFGGCLLGQLCPPSLLIALSVLEGLFFVQQGVRSISLSYAQQTHPVQDVEALAALRQLASRLLPVEVDWHIVLYAYMGVFPSTEVGARLLMDRSAELAARGGAERIIVKTAAEAHRLPTVAENVQSLRSAARAARRARVTSDIPWVDAVHCGDVLTEAGALVDAVLDLSDDIGAGLLTAFSAGLLDVPFCLHEDNRGLTQGAIDTDGRLTWARVGNLPLPSRMRDVARRKVTSSELLGMLRHTADQHDRLASGTGLVPGRPPVASSRPHPDHRSPRGAKATAETEAGTEFVITLSCVDVRGIVHEVTGFLADQGLTILDSQQFTDPSSGRFFLRVHARRQSWPVEVDDLRKEFDRVAVAFGMDWQMRDLSVPHRVILMVSRQGHCLNDLLFRAHTGSLPVEVCAVVSNHRDFEDLATWHGVPFHHVPVTVATKPAAEARLRELVEEYAADTVVLARYMQVLSEDLCRHLAGRVINIHHSLLPSFKGAQPYRQAHERGVKVIGATAHYVTASLDEGPIIEQDFARADHRHSPEQLATLNHSLEAVALARAVKWHAEHRVILNGNRTVVFN